MKMCTICGERKAEVPDRNIMGRRIKRICKECHMNKLREDVAAIMAKHNRKDQA